MQNDEKTRKGRCVERAYDGDEDIGVGPGSRLVPSHDVHDVVGRVAFDEVRLCETSTLLILIAIGHLSLRCMLEVRSAHRRGRTGRC